MDILTATETDAIRYRVMLRDQAEAELQARIREILAAHGAPEGSMVEVKPDGSMSIAPSPQQAEGE